MGRMKWEMWPKLWQATLDGCRALGGEVSQLVIVQPATEHEIEVVEAELGVRLPESFREVMLLVSSRVEFWWSLPDDIDPPVDGVFSGGCCWDLAALSQIEHRRREMVRARFSDVEDAYGVVWHDKLSFYDAPEGDQIAFDLSARGGGRVVYLSSEGGEGHNCVLGCDFVDFIHNWSLIGCPGPEDWQMLPFFSLGAPGLDPYSEDAKQWRRWLGLDNAL